MNFKKILVPVGGLVIVALAYRAYGLGGVAAALGGVVMWILMHYTRLMQVLKRANNNPIGYVGSAVMLNAKLRPGVPLIHVLALTRALGELQSPEGEEPEIYRWTDGTRSHVTAEFRGGKLVQWTLVRPPAEDDEAPSTP
ncbi:glycerate kinase [Curvibacter sp. HBC28]|uniref:Glycerate kinase n=1 Tax=Curvibacter microcysteis TaxID=3026419 RepID=A0ABT5MB71_9BURK|nr:glycerate kinase [Curvibacter sp. HBC28]MDD0813815.1 glycerate kinase [Curvibacter sp. HBC28]